MRSVKKRAVIYARSAAGTKGDLDKQVKMCTKRARKDGYAVDRVFADRASGLNPNREGIQQVVLMAENHEVDAVYVTDIARLSRDIDDLDVITNLIRGNGVELHVFNPIEEKRRSDSKRLVTNVFDLAQDLAINQISNRNTN